MSENKDVQQNNALRVLAVATPVLAAAMIFMGVALCANACKRGKCNDCGETTNIEVKGNNNIVNRDGVVNYEDIDVSNSGSGNVNFNKSTDINNNNRGNQTVVAKPKPKPKPKPVVKPEPIVEPAPKPAPVPEPCQTVTKTTYKRITIEGTPDEVAMALRAMGYGQCR